MHLYFLLILIRTICASQIAQCLQELRLKLKTSVECPCLLSAHCHPSSRPVLKISTAKTIPLYLLLKGTIFQSGAMYHCFAILPSCDNSVKRGHGGRCDLVLRCIRFPDVFVAAIWEQGLLWDWPIFKRFICIWQSRGNLLWPFDWLSRGFRWIGRHIRPGLLIFQKIFKISRK